MKAKYQEIDYTKSVRYSAPTRYSPADIEEILRKGIEIMILTRGMQLMLHTCPETEQLLHQRNIEYHIGQTKLAVALFNDFVQQGKRVGGIFHSTC
ncbi:MAG: hypothetical protein HC796_12185 [Synechococcaceae cyanobacterium RL_1_2]|nr:hypothetical protein [Synechococcaceae cyanobacterium RL_1_2]